MKKLIVASNNTHKVDEIKCMMGDRFVIVSLLDENINIEIEEVGSTFFENALIKAKTIYDLTGNACIADDSGLSVAALDGEPGVYSARYAGEPCNDKKNNEKLLQRLSDKNVRRAKFVSNIVLYYAKDTFISTEGEVEGVILHEYRGTGGFGYDPLFYVEELKKTFGEASPTEKNRISHRFRAIEQLVKKLQEMKFE